MTRRDLDILAGEYVLGTADKNARAKAEKLMASDPAFARSVSDWERRLGPLSEAVSPLEPPATAWNMIEAALTGAGAAASTPLTQLAGQLAALKRSLDTWRFATMAATAAALALAFVWLGGVESPMRPPQAEERYVAMLQNDQGETAFLVTMDMKDKRFAIRPLAVKTPPSNSYELWAILKGGDKPPMTAGIVGTEAYAMMDVPSQITRDDIEKGIELAISLEPKGGAPSGKSMGPIMFAGLLVKQTP